MMADSFWGHDYVTRWMQKKSRGPEAGEWITPPGYVAGSSDNPDADPLSLPNRVSELTGRISALLRERGKHKGEDPASTEKKIKSLLPPVDGGSPMGVPQMDPKKRDLYYDSLAKLHDHLQAEADERGVMHKKGLLKGQNFVPVEDAFTGPHNPVDNPRVLSGKDKALPSLKGHPGVDTGVMHGPEPPPDADTEYDMRMRRMKGILSPEEEAQVKGEWKDKLLNPRDDSRQRAALLMATGLGKAFVAPGAYGKYAVPAAQAALDMLNQGQEGAVSELDRQEDAFNKRIKGLEAGLDYDDKYARREETRSIPELTIDGKPISAAEFELLMQYAGPELGPKLAGEITGNDPRLVGPMAERYAAGTADAKAQLQRAQAEKAMADAELIRLKGARTVDMAPLEKRKLEAQITELEAKAREKEVMIQAIQDMLK